MTYTTSKGYRITIENPNPKETLLELYPDIKIKEDEPKTRIRSTNYKDEVKQS